MNTTTSAETQQPTAPVTQQANQTQESGSDNRVQFPKQLTLSNGTVLNVDEVPELKAFSNDVSAAAESRFKAKFYPQLQSEKDKVNNLTSDMNKANVDMQQLAGFLQYQQQEAQRTAQTYEQQMNELKNFNKNTPIDTNALGQVVGAIFDKKIADVLPGLQQRTEKLESAHLQDYKERRLAEMGNSIFPELVKGNTVEDIEASIVESAALKAKYFPTNNTNQTPNSEQQNDQNMYPNNFQNPQQFPQQPNGYPQQPAPQQQQNVPSQQQPQTQGYQQWNGQQQQPNANNGYSHQPQQTPQGYAPQQNGYPQQHPVNNNGYNNYPSQYNQPMPQAQPVNYQQSQVPLNGNSYPYADPHMQNSNVVPMQVPMQPNGYPVQPQQQAYPQPQQHNGFNNGYGQQPVPPAPPVLGNIPTPVGQPLPDIRNMSPEEFARERGNLMSTLGSMFANATYTSPNVSR